MSFAIVHVTILRYRKIPLSSKTCKNAAIKAIIYLMAEFFKSTEFLHTDFSPPENVPKNKTFDRYSAAG